MKKLLLLLTLSVLASCSDVAYGQLFTINQFTQIEKVDGVIKATVPINLQYALKQDIAPSFHGLFAFEAAGIGHSFDGSQLIINELITVAGVGIKPVNAYPVTVGICAGANWSNQKFIAGFSTDIELQPLASATARMVKPKSKHNFKISL